MRGIITAGILALVGSIACAQQDPQYTQYMFDRMSVNPAVAGSTGNICATALLRQQWTGFDGAPKTGLINLQAPITKINSGLGLTAYFDKLGQEKSTIVRLHYAYHLKVGSQSTLSAGVYAGLSGRALEGRWVAIDDVASDNAIPGAGRSANGFDLGAGLYFKSPQLWLGISSTQLPETELKDVSIQNKRHYYVQAGYDWAIGGDRKYILQPSALLKSDANSTQVDLSALFLYDEMLWIGASYRTEDAIAPMIGYQHKFPKGDSMVRIGYSYDVTTSELKNYSSGSHEVMLSYCFKIVKPVVNEIYRHPRFL
ncbi:MAG: type IX secretion system membrane protein PorP/SprF [Flavobacteriales bacterium]|nr:type IX secretion system membrane protein PorP/SprF [Flavobacteriales bacterium]MCL4283271.1 type IX secretion system membrane protein PorP/SprF [Flavobacteriales bacterium]